MRLTDKRFLSDGFYEPKSRDERKEIILMEKPSYNDIYKRLGEYENTNVQPSEIENLGILTFEKFSDIIRFGTAVMIYEDFKDDPIDILWSGVWDRGMKKRKLFDDNLLNSEVTNISIDGGFLQIGICYQ